MELISGIREPNSGKIKFKNSHHRLGEIAYMQQKDLLLPWLNVEENILLPLKIMGKITTESIEDMKNKASAQKAMAAYERTADSVSYTHLTLPTKA